MFLSIIVLYVIIAYIGNYFLIRAAARQDTMYKTGLAMFIWAFSPISILVMGMSYLEERNFGMWLSKKFFRLKD